jgi:hypothetical protein
MCSTPESHLKKKKRKKEKKKQAEQVLNVCNSFQYTMSYAGSSVFIYCIFAVLRIKFRASRIPLSYTPNPEVSF